MQIKASIIFLPDQSELQEQATQKIIIIKWLKCIVSHTAHINLQDFCLNADAHTKIRKSHKIIRTNSTLVVQTGGHLSRLHLHVKNTYPGFDRMHRQKSLKGPGTVLNGFPSKQACKATKKRQKIPQHIIYAAPQTCFSEKQLKAIEYGKSSKIELKTIRQ